MNSKPNWDFCVKSYKVWSLEETKPWKGLFATILNEFNQSLERKKNLSSLVYVLKKNYASRNIV